MDINIDHFSAEMAARIQSLERDQHSYQQLHNKVKRSNGYRIFRKVVGVILEIAPYLAAAACPFIIFVIEAQKQRAIDRLQDALIGYERHVNAIIHAAAKGRTRKSV
jgi:hypothetical protein